MTELKSSLNQAQADLQQEMTKSALEIATAAEKLSNLKSEYEEKLSEAKNKVTKYCTLKVIELS